MLWFRILSKQRFDFCVLLNAGEDLLQLIENILVECIQRIGPSDLDDGHIPLCLL